MRNAEAAWLIVQHAVSDVDFMKRCIPLLKQAVVTQQAESWQLAFLQDRVLTMSNEPQIYGTQFDYDDNGGPIPFPIREPGSVNLRRSELGLNSLEERVEEMRQRARWAQEQRKKAPPF